MPSIEVAVAELAKTDTESPSPTVALGTGRLLSPWTNGVSSDDTICAEGAVATMWASDNPLSGFPRGRTGVGFPGGSAGLPGRGPAGGVGVRGWRGRTDRLLSPAARSAWPKSADKARSEKSENDWNRAVRDAVPGADAMECEIGSTFKPLVGSMTARLANGSLSVRAADNGPSWLRAGVLDVGNK